MRFFVQIANFVPHFGQIIMSAAERLKSFDLSLQQKKVKTCNFDLFVAEEGFEPPTFGL